MKKIEDLKEVSGGNKGDTAYEQDMSKKLGKSYTKFDIGQKVYIITGSKRTVLGIINSIRYDVDSNTNYYRVKVSSSRELWLKADDLYLEDPFRYI